MDVIIDINLYKKSLVEIVEILKYLKQEDLCKIPENVLKTIDENKDAHYSWKYDVSKKLEEQNLSEYTLALLAYINQEYLLTQEQKEIMDKIYRQNS